MVVLVDGGVVESFTDSSAAMAGSPVHVPVPNGAATTRSFLPAQPPFELNPSKGGRGVYLGALPAGVSCSLMVADLEL